MCIDLHCCKHYFMSNLISLVLLPLFMVLVYSIIPPVMYFGSREIQNTITSVFSVITRKCTKGSSCRLHQGHHHTSADNLMLHKCFKSLIHSKATLCTSIKMIYVEESLSCEGVKLRNVQCLMAHQQITPSS